MIDTNSLLSEKRFFVDKAESFFKGMYMYKRMWNMEMDFALTDEEGWIKNRWEVLRRWALDWVSLCYDLSISGMILSENVRVLEFLQRYKENIKKNMYDFFHNNVFADLVSDLLDEVSIRFDI